MSYREDDRFGSDLYEGDGVLFIHDGRNCQAKISPLIWFLGPCWIGLAVLVAIGGIAESQGSWFELLVAFGLGCLVFLALPPTWCLIILALQTWWGIQGQQTLRIDGRQIRHDWWGPWGHGCKSWARDRIMTVTTVPGEATLASCGALVIQIGKTRVKFHLVTPAEAEWLCEKVNRFLEATHTASPKPGPESLKKHAVKTRGKLHDADSGLTILKSLETSGRLEIDGKPLLRVEPGVETHREPPQSNGPIPVRCGRCHAQISRDRVLPDLATAQCTACGFVFSLPELERIPPPRQKRVSCCRSEIGNLPELRITQGGDFSLYPVFTLFAALCAVGLLFGLGWYIWRLDPASGLRELFPESSRESPGEQLFRLFIMAGFLGSFALLPLWAFLERRTLTLDRDICRMEVQLLFFRWRRTVPRSEVLFAEHKTSWTTRELCRLRYGRRKTFNLTFTYPCGADWLTGEINHFLYTLPPDDNQGISQETVAGNVCAAAEETSDRFAGTPRFLTGHLRSRLLLQEKISLAAACFGGMHGACAALLPLCPHCGNMFSKDDSFDLSHEESHCVRCGQTFLTTRFVKVIGPSTAMLVLEGMEIDETTDRLEIRYHHPFNKTSFWGIIVGYVLFILMWVVMLTPLVFIKEDGGMNTGLLVMLGIMIVLVIGMVIWFFIVFMNEIRIHREWCWQMTITPRQFELVLSWSNREKRVAILREDMSAVDWNETADLKSWWHTVFREKMPTSLQYPLRDGLHLDLRDGMRIYLPMVTAPSSQHATKQRREIMAGILFKIKNCRYFNGSRERSVAQ